MLLRLGVGVVLALGISLTACGGDDDDESPDTPGESPTQSNGNVPDGGSNASDSGGAGNATVEITGVERFTFDVTCSFGTGIIEGPGTRDDGEPAYLRGGIAVTDSGEPREDGQAVGFNIKVGIAQLAGQADYEWTVGDTAGRQDPVTNDGKTVSGTAGFEYRDDRPEPRFAYGEVMDGIFDMACP